MTNEDKDKIVLDGGRLFRWYKNSKLGVVIVSASMKKMLKYKKQTL